MQRIISLTCLALALIIGTGTAMADSIKGRLGVTGRLGFNVPAESDFNDRKLETDAGFIGGGGFIYGIDNNLAAEIDVTHTEFDAERVSGVDEGEFSVTNISLGVQYRFIIPQPKLVPYAGGGLDILLSDHRGPIGTSSRDADVDTVVGVHVSGGIDYFLTKQIVLNAELKGVVAPETDIQTSREAGNFDPSSVAGTVGIRVFFN